MADNFFDLTNRDDRFEITPGLIPTFPNGLRALGGNDVILGSQGADTISGNQGDDLLRGLDGADVLVGGRQRDTLEGGNDGDRLFGNRGDDQLRGGAGPDLLHGGKAQDLLEGGAGDDTLWGDLGADTLSGGEGADVFVLRPDGPNADVIQDWDFNVDRIGLSFGLTPAQIQVVPLATPQPVDPDQVTSNVGVTPPTGVQIQLSTGQILATVLTGRVSEFTPNRFVVL